VEFEVFLGTEVGGLLGFARLLTGDRGTAEDMVQEVLTRMWVDRARFASLDNPQAYVRRAVVNQYLSWGRRWFRVRPVGVLPNERSSSTERTSRDRVEQVEPVDGVDLVAVRDELRIGIARLPARQRAVVVMRFYLDLDDDEIAHSLGCRPSTVRSHASHALAALRISMSPQTKEAL
jgi:RNA polymerase sigma factor (sigma-70 family)